MPNWCSNTLNVTGPGRAVRALMAQVADAHPDHEEPTALSLAKISPPPPGLDLVLDTDTLVLPGRAAPSGRLTAGSAIDGRSWRLAHWGTKWDVTAKLNVMDDRAGTLTATFSFDSAWGPAQPAIDTLARQYPTCAFALSYDEPGMNFSGEVEWENGNVVSDVQGESETWDDEDADQDADEDDAEQDDDRDGSSTDEEDDQA